MKESMKKPAYATPDEALRSGAHVYLHSKGGIYELLLKNVEDKITGSKRLLVVYRHLWPHAPQVYVRPQEEFYDTVLDESGKGVPRFMPARNVLKNPKLMKQLRSRK